MARTSTALVVLFCLFLVVGCRGPVLLSDPRPVTFFPMETAAVEHAIVAGMAKLGWVASRDSPGLIRGTLHLRTHTVIVHVAYTTDTYQISYVDSENMKYELSPEGYRMIHPNYNSWVRNLEREINRRLVPPAPGATDFPADYTK